MARVTRAHRNRKRLRARPGDIVDDGSPEPARQAGARVIASDDPPGPGGARNMGWRLAATELVAFVDAYCLVGGNWARPLAAALLAADPGLALAAPRVRGGRGPGRAGALARIRSPLDMGVASGLVGPGRRVCGRA